MTAWGHWREKGVAYRRGGRAGLETGGAKGSVCGDERRRGERMRVDRSPWSFSAREGVQGDCVTGE